MAMTKVFQSGNSQAVRIPREFKIDAEEIEIVRVGQDLVLRTPQKNLGRAYDILLAMPKDFFREGRKQPKAEKRLEL